MKSLVNVIETYKRTIGSYIQFSILATPLIKHQVELINAFKTKYPKEFNTLFDSRDSRTILNNHEGSLRRFTYESPLIIQDLKAQSQKLKTLDLNY